MSAAGATHSRLVVAFSPVASLSLAASGPIVPILHAAGSMATKFAPYTTKTFPPSSGPRLGLTESTRMSSVYVMIISDWLTTRPSPVPASTVTAPALAAGGDSHRSIAVDTKCASTPTAPNTHFGSVSTKSAPNTPATTPPPR